MPKAWNNKEHKILLDNYRDLPNITIAKMVGRSASAVKRKMYQLGLKRTPAEHRKIMHMVKTIPNAGQFKKGNLPHNTKYNGHERITVDGYIEVRIKQGVYRLKHLYNWEKVNGKLKPGYCLRCIDGNVLNTDASNWKMITRQENMLLNTTKHNYLPEVIPTAAMLAKLKTTLKHLENG